MTSKTSFRSHGKCEMLTLMIRISKFT